ncbi:hypothetical protein GXW78_27310 [Roseomonas terrae]|uniref:ANTAR domain-containing protein n=1 Tax=Neoroseomonas terrae TaxID=424799 RepID=A0ABS5EQS3_9PROT|nr:hypothetical protein [Neoroseomonas terrae]MBR0653389.1 hypothetical protein [Neoroseomonas terrae]
MMVPVPPELGAIGDTPEDASRLSDIADHIFAVLKHRALTPAEQVLILTEAAISIVAVHVPDPQRALAFMACLTGSSLSIARTIAREKSALLDMPAAGRA